MTRQCASIYRSSRRGFTMVELLLALALSALLAAALSAMIGQAARDRRAMADQPIEPAWAGLTLRLLQQDLEQARWWAGTSDQVVLLGLGRDGQPAQVTYRWQVRGGHTSLVRIEQPLTQTVLRHQPPRVELIAIDPAGLAIGPYRFGGATLDQHPAEPARAKRPSPRGAVSAGGKSIQINGVPVPLQAPPDQIELTLVTDSERPQTVTRKAVLQ